MIAPRFFLALPIAVAIAVAPVAAASPSECLTAGRTQVVAKRYDAAIATFQSCLTQAPGDEVVLSELTAATILAGQPDTDLARRAVEAAHTPAVRAASLYSLGLAMHDDPDPVLETEAYLASLRLRPNAQVAARLAKIDPGAQVEPTLIATPMSGPYATLKGGCPDVVKRARVVAAAASRHDTSWRCTCSPDAEVHAASPWQGAATVQVACTTKLAEGNLAFLAAKTSAGWFVSSAPVMVAVPENQKRCDSAGKVGSVELAGALLRVASSWSTSCGGGGMDKDFAWTAVSVAGIGASGMPSLVGPVTLSNAHKFTIYSEQDREVSLARWKLEAAITAAGELELSGAPAGWSRAVVERVVKTHALPFP